MFQKANTVILMAILSATAICITACLQKEKTTAETTMPAKHKQPKWIIPDTAELTGNENDRLIKYGHALVVNTAYYFGPRGTVAHRSNGMNCQNCHLDAGTRLFGNNFSLTASGYPRFKERSGTVENLVKNVVDCFERSLNG